MLRFARLPDRARRPPAAHPAPRMALGAVGAAWLVACSVPVAGDLDDSEASRVFVALDREGLAPTKESDPNVDGKWRIEVPPDDAARAFTVMHSEQLPRRSPPGVLDAVGKGSLVPSEALEQAQLMTGIAGDLERTLEGIDGVISAHVHLSLSHPSGWRDPEPSRATASALVEYRGTTPPFGEDAVQRLVAGGAGGLLPTDVLVVLIARPAQPGVAPSGDVVHVGPIAVTRASKRWLQAIFAGLLGLIAILATTTFVLYARQSRARAARAREAPLVPPSP
jgi:type III secretion protein J